MPQREWLIKIGASLETDENELKFQNFVLKYKRPKKIHQSERYLSKIQRTSEDEEVKKLIEFEINYLNNKSNENSEVKRVIRLLRPVCSICQR